MHDRFRLLAGVSLSLLVHAALVVVLLRSVPPQVDAPTGGALPIEIALVPMGEGAPAGAEGKPAAPSRPRLQGHRGRAAATNLRAGAIPSSPTSSREVSAEELHEADDADTEETGDDVGAATGGEAGGPTTGEGAGGGTAAGGGAGGGTASGGGGFALRRLSGQEPSYPPLARRRGVEGNVTLRLLIGPDGAVKEATVARADPAGIFEQAAVDAVRTWRFAPSPGGAPTMAELDVRFRLD